MKDFDFDELDRAVNSVLATKDTKTDTAADPATGYASQQAVQVTDQPNDSVPVTVQAQSEEQNEEQANTDSHEDAQVDAGETEGESTQVEVNSSVTEDNSAEDEQDEKPVAGVDEQEDLVSETHDTVEVVPQEDDDDTSKDEESSPEAAPTTEDKDEHTAALAAIPVKRGRFMDMVAPGTVTNDSTKKPMPVRSGVTLTPSSDFVATTPLSEESESVSQDAAQNDAAMPLIESQVEPEITTTTADGHINDEDSSNEHSDEVENKDGPAVELDTENSGSFNPAEVPVASAPFIPDVPVEKRPLNAFSGDATESTDALKTENATEDVEALSVTDPTLSASAPKEFDKDIMAVEANETVGEQDTSQVSSETPNDTSAPAITATGAEPHPMFDTSTLAHSGMAAAHHTSKMSWAIVGVSLFIVGAALGVLYFLYGQG